MRKAWLAAVIAFVMAPSAVAADLVIGLAADVTSIDPHVLNAARKGYTYTPRADERTYAHEVKPQ